MTTAASVSVRDFRRPPAKFRKPAALGTAQCHKCQRSGALSSKRSWRVSCAYLDERSVFRAAVLSIVLTLAIGPNAVLLCSVWCHPHEVKTSACQHQGATASPQVTGEDSCRTAATLTAFVREDAKRGQTFQATAPVPQFGLTPPRTDATRNSRSNTALAAVTPPILIALRI
jgi:hypothetical protein